LTVKSCSDIAAALAASLNDDEALEVEFSIQFTAEHTDGPPELARQVGSARVVCYGIDEGEDPPFDLGGGVKATRVVNVLLQCPINEQVSLAMCQAWMNEVKEACRELILSDRWYHQANETVTPYDADLLAEQRQFVALVKATFYDFC
jgi:hypothetical protein